MEAAIVRALAGIIEYLAVRGVDKIVAKWVAYFTIAWEARASEGARAKFFETVRVIKEGMRDSGGSLADWRRDHWPRPGGTNAPTS